MRLATIITLFIINSAAFAQVGDPFPAMETEKLDDTAFSIPKDTNGKFSLLGLAYSKRSEKDLETWFSPVYNKFMRDSKDAGLFSSFGYDVNVYFIPMFTGIKAAGTGAAKKAAVKKAAVKKATSRKAAADLLSAAAKKGAKRTKKKGAGKLSPKLNAKLNDKIRDLIRIAKEQGSP